LSFEGVARKRIREALVAHESPIRQTRQEFEQVSLLFIGEREASDERALAWVRPAVAGTGSVSEHAPACRVEVDNVL
jgi:hypothetical protein